MSKSIPKTNTKKIAKTLEKFLAIVIICNLLYIYTLSGLGVNRYIVPKILAVRFCRTAFFLYLCPDCDEVDKY